MLGYIKHLFLGGSAREKLFLPPLPSIWLLPAATKKGRREKNSIIEVFALFSELFFVKREMMRGEAEREKEKSLLGFSSGNRIGCGLCFVRFYFHLNFPIERSTGGLIDVGTRILNSKHMGGERRAGTKEMQIFAKCIQVYWSGLHLQFCRLSLSHTHIFFWAAKIQKLHLLLLFSRIENYLFLAIM